MKSSNKYLSDVVIRQFRTEDYDAVITVWNDAGLPYKPEGRDSRDKIEQELNRGNPIFLVAEVNGALVGSILGTHDGRKAWINRLAVASQFQRKGIAKRLIAEVESRLSELGFEIIACLIEDENLKSMRLFKSMGYKKHSDIVYFTKRRTPDI